MKTILEHARMLSRDRLSLGFNDTFSGMIEKLRDSFPEKTHEQLYQMAKRLLEAKGIDVRFGSCKECTYFCGDPYGGAHLCTCPNRKDLPLADNPCSEYTPK